MSFADFQSAVNSEWRQRKHPVRPVRQRKKHLCVECGKKGYEVKMEYIENRHVRMLATVYDVTRWKCPRCGHVDKEQMRIEGRGKRGVNMGRLFGGM